MKLARITTAKIFLMLNSMELEVVLDGILVSIELCRRSNTTAWPLLTESVTKTMGLEYLAED